MRETLYQVRVTEHTKKRTGTCSLFLPQKKVVEQLRRDLLVKQEDMKLQTLQADGQMSTLLITQTQTPLPAASLTTSQVPTQHTGNCVKYARTLHGTSLKTKPYLC